MLENITEGVRKALRDKLQLTDALCVAGDIDALFTAAQNTNSELSCFIQFAGGTENANPAFKMDNWVWNFTGFLLVRFAGDTAAIEVRMRQLVDTLVKAFKSDHTLGQTTPKAAFTMLDQPEPGKVNDVPFYFIFFAIDAKDTL